MNVLNGTVAHSGATRFPAHFSWNMMNRAKNVGSEAYHGWELAKRLGIPTVKSYGGVRLDKIGAWPNRYQIWREAMEYRASGYRYSPANTIAQINEARCWLFDRNQGKPQGGLFALDGRMGELKKVTLADWERGAYIVANSWGEKWSKDGRIYLLYSAMIDPT